MFLADGEAAFQEVFHCHLHVFPRFDGDSLRIDAYWQRPPPESARRTSTTAPKRSGPAHLGLRNASAQDSCHQAASLKARAARRDVLLRHRCAGAGTARESVSTRA
ncbi:HIT family protein [Arthrobacter sp. L77]|uniref:HIT family protein n=1 Tax=Arthrobacter sp. L77 TaxID=1496689 RepID=UPI003FA4BC7A